MAKVSVVGDTVKATDSDGDFVTLSVSARGIVVITAGTRRTPQTVNAVHYIDVQIDTAAQRQALRKLLDDADRRSRK